MIVIVIVIKVDYAPKLGFGSWKRQMTRFPSLIWIPFFSSSGPSLRRLKFKDEKSSSSSLEPSSSALSGDMK